MRKTILTTALGVSVIAGAASAGMITGWDTTNVTLATGPFIDYVTYSNTIYNDDGVSNGIISWKQSNVQPYGMKVVNGDDAVSGLNCLMTTGYNEFDGTDKMCSDPLQSSKRIKMKNTANGPLDVVLTVQSGDTYTYRSLQKLTNATPDSRWENFTIELGSGTGSGFVASAAGDGLGFSDTRGKFFSATTPVTTYQSKDLVFSAYFADGLSGPIDKYHPEPGYFNVEERMWYNMEATEDEIVSTGISSTYSDVFGAWLNSAGVPIAIFWDNDGDINTDNILMANCADSSNFGHVGTHTGDDVTGFVCNGTWVTNREQAGLDSIGAPYPSEGIPKPVTVPDDLAPVVYDSITAAIAANDSQPMYMDYIEDAANLGLNFWITVDDTFTGDSITIRYTPIGVDNGGGEPAAEICFGGVDEDNDGAVDCDDSDCVGDPICDVPPVDDEICDDGIDNDGDGAADCADPDCSGVGFCGAEGKFDTCSDGFDNDGDGDVDCSDSGCSKNKSCR